jgi:hypothetical protein
MINAEIVQVRISTSALGLGGYCEELYRFGDKSGVDRTYAELCNFVRLFDQGSGRCSMKYRIAIWAAAGFLVASGWAAYFFLKDKDLPIERWCPLLFG